MSRTETRSVYVTNGLPVGVLYGPKRKPTTAMSGADLLEKISLKKTLVGKEIDYDSFEHYTRNLRTKGYEELVYPFESLRVVDLIEYTLYSKDKPIFGKGIVLSVDDAVIVSKTAEILKSDVVRLFRKQASVRQRGVRALG